ncbi:UvrD-helicase domain-containing protein [Candidatus Curtissbacteria bacterium]|nr:UvrD-helicase domain-containing protein [Candidatus Curtissbacteria bacterium]
MSTILKDLNPKQKEAVTTTEGPLLIIAGAGTGKTTVITRRIAYIIEKKLAKPAEILALTFTDKASQEMEERVDALVPYGYIDTWIHTFHAFGDRLLRDNALDINLPPDFKVLSRPQQVLFFQQNLFRFNLDYYRPLSNPNKFISAMLSFLSRLKDEDISPEEFSRFAKNQQKEGSDKQEANRIEELAGAYQDYEKFKSEAGVIDFGDQVVKTLKLLRTRERVLKNYRKQFKYILVDEYQDTNFAQNELVKLLAVSHQNICVVGDDDQSIYKFRGAAISNILEFAKDFPKAKQVVLTENYRTNQSILNSAYRLITNNNPNRLEVQNKIDKRLKSQRGQGMPPQEIFTETISEEADAVVEEIEKLMKKKVKGYSYRDFAILVRANASADFFLRSLNMKDIPHKFIGSSGLYQQEEVGVLISFLNAISNFEDSINLYNLIISDIYQMPPQEAIKLLSFAKRKTRSLYYVLKNPKGPSLEELGLSKEAGEIIKKVLIDLDEAINLSRREKVGRVLYDFLKRTDYLNTLTKIDTVDAQVKTQNIAKFFDKIKQFETVAKVETVIQFVDYLQALRSAGDDPATVEFDPNVDAVNVMTVHQAKGLEFPVVFLVNLTSDNFPTRSRTEAIEVPEQIIKETLPSGDWHIQEERRLFYVGATRAKDLLYFSFSKDVGGKRLKKVSPFVLEALDKPQIAGTVTKASPHQKIEKFAPVALRTTQTVLFDVDVLKLTQGSIDDYLTCAFKYRYVHLLRVPILRHHAIIYGSALHLAVAAFLRSKKSGNMLTLPQTLEVFENAWDSEGFLTQEHEEKRKMQGKLAMEAFYKRETNNKDIPGLIESSFKFSLEGVMVVGRYDRLDVKPGSKVTIIDYKSSENINQERADAQAEESTQLAVYALAYFKNYRIMPGKVLLHFLENGIEGGYTPTKKDIEKTEKLIVGTAENITRDIKNDSFKANPKYFGREPACVYCAYNSICPFSLSKIS